VGADGRDETVTVMITTMEMGIVVTNRRAKAKGRRGSQVRTRMSANRSIRARRMDETRAMDCGNNHDIDASRPRLAQGEKGRMNHTVVTWSMHRRSDITCIHGMERQQAKMSIALGGEIEHDGL
jgi:hypothetical protein